MKLFCMAIVAVTAVGSFGDVIHWIGPDGGDWWDAANWSPATVPQSSEHLVRLTTDRHPGGRYACVTRKSSPSPESTFLKAENGLYCSRER